MKAKKIFYILVATYIAIRYARFVKWQREMAAKYPGPPVSLLTGNITQMIECGGFTEELFFNLHGKYGDIIRFFIFPNMMNLSIADPDMVNELYKESPTRPVETYMFLWYLGKENLLFQHGPHVKEMRLIYGTMITAPSQLSKLHDVSMNKFKYEIEQWSTPANQPAKSIDAFAVLGPAIYDVMGQVMFDAPWLTTELGRKIYKLHKYLIENVNRWVLYPVGPIWHPAFIKYLMTIREWRGLIGGLLDERARAINENPTKYENDGTAMTTILKAKVKGTDKPYFSRERAISTMCGFLNGAYDTTHATSFWMLFHLAKYPECQTKILEEFHRLQIPEKPSVEDLRKCEYLDAFIKESMRMRATVPVNQRVNLDHDVTIRGIVIPKGVNVNIPMGVIAKDSRWFGADPEKIRPERFLGDSQEAKRARESWAFFGGHSRLCVGFIFAMAEMKAMLHAFLTSASIELEDPNEPGEIMLEAGVNQPKKHFKFIFRQRNLQKIREEENLRWWMEQTGALAQYSAGKVAPTA
jgi:cytochrome P450